MLYYSAYPPVQEILEVLEEENISLGAWPDIAVSQSLLIETNIKVICSLVITGLIDSMNLFSFLKKLNVRKPIKVKSRVSC